MNSSRTQTKKLGRRKFFSLIPMHYFSHGRPVRLRNEEFQSGTMKSGIQPFEIENRDPWIVGSMHTFELIQIHTDPWDLQSSVFESVI